MRGEEEIFALIGIISMIVILIFGLATYLLKAFALYSMSKKLGRKNAFLAFIPYANLYQEGVVAGEIQFEKKKISNMGIWTLVSSLIVGVVIAVSYVIFFAMVMITASHKSSYSRSLDITDFGGMFASYTVFLLVVVISSMVINIVFSLTRYKTISFFYKNRFTPLVHTLLSTMLPFYTWILYLVLVKRPVVEDYGEGIVQGVAGPFEEPGLTS